MIQQFEKDYADIIADVVYGKNRVKTRNGFTYSKFGKFLTVPVGETKFPLIQGRRMYPYGILGEFAAIIRKPKHILDFQEWGCNYWNAWGDSEGFLNVDYGNVWFDFNGVDQIAELRRNLREDPTNRRMVVTGWKPNGMGDLSLPCCHMMYQFYVEKGKLHMLWTQRSVDLMVGLPSDIVFAATWLIALARELELVPGDVHFSLGDCHVYEEHLKAAEQYLANVDEDLPGKIPTYRYTAPLRHDFTKFEPRMLVLSTYASFGPLQLELKV